MESWHKTFQNKRIWDFSGHPTKDSFKTQLHYDRYWEKEKEFHSVGFADINPLLYKYLTLYPIAARADGSLSYPMFFEYDNEEIFPSLQLSMQHGTDQIVLKGRDVGFSSRYIGFIAPEMALSFPRSNVCLTSDNFLKTKGIAKTKIMDTLNNMVEQYKPEYKESEKYGIHFIQEDSYINVVDTNSRPNAFQKVEGIGYIYVVVDEGFIHEYGDKLQQTLVFSQKKQGRKVGFTVIGGSATLNSKGLSSMQSMWESAKQLGIKPIFMPPQEYILALPKYDKAGNAIEGKYEDCTDKYGRPDKKRVIELIKRTRGILEKLNDKSIVQAYTLRYPLEVDEVFQFSSSAFWDRDEVKLIEEQKKVVSSAGRKDSPFREKFFTLHLKDDNTVLPMQGSNGEVVVIEPPRKGCEYDLATDPIPATSSVMDSRSKLCSIVFKTRDENGNRLGLFPVAYYKQRKSDAKKMFDTIVAMQIWYNDAKNDFEKTNGFGTFFALYKSANALHRLHKTPVKFIPKNATKIEYGMPKHNDNAGEMYDNMHSMVLSHISNIHAAEFFKEYKAFLLENCDFMDALVIGCYRQKLIAEGKTRNNAANFMMISVWDGRQWVKKVKMKVKTK